MRRAGWFIVTAAAIACAPSGDPGKGPEVGSQTNWLTLCEASSECGQLECICGTCTAACESEPACEELPGAFCIATSEQGAIALCGGRAPERGVCLPRCEASCDEGTHCVAGVCVPSGVPTVRVTIDPSERHQVLIGFGASLAYADDVIVARDDKAALFDLVFETAGLDALRMRNRYESESDVPLQPAREIIAAATERLGRTPFLFMTSGSPPAALKANASRTCAGNPESCTLVTLPEAGFDYAGFAEHWRASLAAYADAEITPDYVSIQNNPNWIPPQQAPNEACRFLPEEGSASVLVDGMPVDVAYPGYREALMAVHTAIADLPMRPRLAGPETSGLGDLRAFFEPLQDAPIDALALHLYGLDPTAVDLAMLQMAGALGAQSERPVLQTEVQAQGVDTAVLTHYALTEAGASAYLQNDLVAWTPGTANLALVLLTDDGLQPQGPYYALLHFARHTDPGWVRVGAASEPANSSDTSAATELLSSAWLSPDDDALTIVLVNPAAEEVIAELRVPDALQAQFTRSQITRTVLEGVERAAELGALPADGVVRMPARSIATVALSLE